MHFPRKGDTLDTTKVLASSAVLDNDILKYEVVFPKGTKTKQVPTLLKKFFSMQVIPSHDNLVVRHHDYTVKPKAGNVAVVGAMHIPPVVRANPSVQDFDQDYSKMEMTNPETYFRKHDTAPLNSPQFRAKMFTFVSMMGENYGYGTDKHIFHRRASLIMPKIKITKAVPQAKMMYHTHPRKDEPSLSSPDDYLLYMDLSHKPRSIRHFYTVMADRMDYFTVKPKKNSKENYVKLNEDKILKELTDEMDDIEAKWDKKTPKTGDYQDDLRFCENITRDFVKWLNKRYSKYFTITYKCYYKVKKNPPEPEIEDLHLGDEMLEKSLDSIKSRDYTWTPSVKTRAHEDSAYWHQLRYLDTLGNSAKTLGISPQGSMKRAYDTYMNKAFEESKFSYYDALNILNLAHDISSADSKIRDGGELSSRLTDICSYLELDETSTETLLLLEEVIHNENLFTEEAKTMCGDFYGLALLSSYAIQAVGAIQSVKEGKKEYSVVEYEVYSSLKEETQKRFEEFLLGEKDHRGYAMGENAPASRGFVDSFLNPPTVTTQRIELRHTFPTEAFSYDFDLVKEALDEFNVEKYEPAKSFVTGRNALNLRFPVTTGKVSMTIQPSTGTAQIFVTRRPNPMEDALDAVTKVGTALVRYGLPGVDPEEYDVKAIDVAQNPQSSQVIAIAGPSGAGKSTTIRNLLKLLPNSKTAPTVTTRAKRKSDKPGERIFISVEQFKKEMTQDKLVAAELQKNGNYYGRRKSDFKGADYVIIDVNPRGVNAIKRAYPNAFTVYLEPVEDPEFIRKRLLRRGDMSPQEARGRAAIIPKHIKGSKNIDFDMRVKTKQGEFAKIALEIEPMIPKQNPSLRDLVEQVYEEEEEGLSIKPSGEADVVIHGDVINAINSNVHVGDKLSGRSRKDIGDILSGRSRKAGENMLSDGSIINNPSIRELVSNVLSDGTPSITWDKSKHSSGLQLREDLVVDVPIADIEEAFQKDKGYYVPTMTTPKGKVERIAQAAAKGIPLPVPMGGFVNGIFSFSDGRHRYSYTRDFTNDTTIPVALFERVVTDESDTLVNPKQSFHHVLQLNQELSTKEYKKVRGEGPMFGPQAVAGHKIEQEVKARDALVATHASSSKPTKEPYYILSNGKKYFEDGSRTRGNPVIIVTTHFMIRLFTRENRSVRLASEMRWMQQTKSSESRMEQLSARFSTLMDDAMQSGHGLVPPTTPEADQLFKDAMKLLKEYNYLLKESSLRGKLRIDQKEPQVSALTTYINPPRNAKSIRIEESPNKEKKLVAYFYDKDGKKIKTTHFGARGMSDFTQHKDPTRMKRYLARHKGMGENWKDPTTAGALSRWILWGKPSLRESFNDFKKRFKLEGVMAVTNTKMNPSNIPFPIPEEYQEELETRLAEEMTRPGYRPHTIPEVIEEGLYDDAPSDFSYAQGEYEEFLEEIEKGDLDEAYAEYSDVEGHVAYWLYTNHRVIMPIYAQSHVAKTRGRIQIFKDLFEHYGYEHSPAYLKGGSNHEKVFKVRAALDAAADAQGKPRITDNDDQLSFVVRNIVEARKNPMAPGYQSYGWTTQDWRSIKVNNKGDIDYSQKCGAEGTKTPSGSPRLCLPAAVVKSLIRTESGKEVIRKQARKKARAKKGERVPWHPRIKKIWKRIEDKTVKDKPNPPSFISARDPQKWSDRYDRIIKMSGDELMQLAEKQAAEKGLTIELTITTREYKETPRQLKLPPKQQKMYKEYIESMERATITLSRGSKLLDRLRFTILTQSPKELVDYLTNRKVWRKESRGKRLEGLGRIRRRGNTTHFDVLEIPMTATLQNKKRFPFAVAGSGGYQMSEGQKGKGYYGIIKTYQAGFLEANDMEQYGMGESPMRSDLYQSYGWLTAFSYKDNHPYPSKAAEYYLNVAGKSKLANKDADYWNVYRPVYSRKMTGAAYRAGVKKMLDAVTNPPEWRHGEFAEEDPFEEYF
jgi:guanylate kinase